jgi:tetratricopeptide (TPR) repeat protein
LLSPEEFRLRSGYGLVSITPQETRILMGVASDRSLSEGLELAEALRRSRAERVPKDLFRGEVPGDVSELSKDTLVVDDSDVRYESSQFLPELKQPTGELELPRGLPEVQYRFERGREQKEAAEPDLLGELSEEVESGLLGRGEGTGMDVSKPLGRISVGAGGMRAPSELRSTTGRSDRVLAPGIREGEFMPAGARRTTLRGRGEREELPDVRRGTLGKDIYGRMKQQVEGSQKSLDGLPVRSRESGGAMAGVSREQRAKAILGTHESVASFSEDMFNRHMKAAEGYLKEGMYYRASDSYTMALVYKPGSALAYAGKSHALFGAGEYMSSALFLSRTLEALPEYVRRMESAEGQAGRVSIFKLLAPSFRLLERDKLESRAADVVQWQERSDSGELQFLLSYVYYQMGRAEPAKEAIQQSRRPTRRCRIRGR